MAEIEPYELAAQLLTKSQELNALVERARAAGLTVDLMTPDPGLELLVRFPSIEGATQSSMRTYA